MLLLLPPCRRASLWFWSACGERSASCWRTPSTTGSTWTWAVTGTSAGEGQQGWLGHMAARHGCCKAWLLHGMAQHARTLV